MIAHTENPSIQIPACLWGPEVQVRRRWRRIVRKAIQCGNLAQAVIGEEFRDLSTFPGWLLLKERMKEFNHQSHVRVYAIREDLCTTVFAEHRRMRKRGLLSDSNEGPDKFSRWCNRHISALIRSGLSESWFCLGLLGSGLWLSGGATPEHVNESRRLAKAAVLRLLEHWPIFLRLEERFRGPVGSARWPDWAIEVFFLCKLLAEGPAAADLKAMRYKTLADETESPEAVERFLRSWIGSLNLPE